MPGGEGAHVRLDDGATHVRLALQPARHVVLEGEHELDLQRDALQVGAALNLVDVPNSDTNLSSEVNKMDAHAQPSQ